MTALHKHPPAPRAKPTTHSEPKRAGHGEQLHESRPNMGSNGGDATKGGCHAPVTRAGCTRKEGYQNSETRRLCRGLESPVASPISGGGHEWSAGPWKHAPQPIKTPWLESNVALMIMCMVVCAITWVAADHVWTALTMQPGVVWE